MKTHVQNWVPAIGLFVSLAVLFFSFVTLLAII
jgi:hypothetical protein